MGGVRTALYNYLFAKKHGGDFLLRIEDTDQSRFVQGAEKYIVDALGWCGISPDEGIGAEEKLANGGKHHPYRQSERKDIYGPYVQTLIDSELAYLAFDTPNELSMVRERAMEAGNPNWQYNSITRTSMKNSLTLSKTDVEEKKESGRTICCSRKNAS
jgi:glutamyl-tRNA synthetase